MSQGEIILTCLFIAVCALSIVAMHSAYRNGFRDGALWMHEGDGYPSKPHAGWYWWAQAERRGLSPGKRRVVVARAVVLANDEQKRRP